VICINRKRSVIKSKEKETLLKKRNVSMAIVISVIIVIIALSGIYASTLSDQPSENNNSKIDEGDDFAFTALNGSKMHLRDYRGKIVILDMWATWCQPCINQMIELEKTYEKYSKGELEILSINIDTRETIQQVENFIDQAAQAGYELSWVFGMEDENLDEYMPNGSIPTICIFDQKGNLYFSHEGICPYSEIPAGWPDDTVTLAKKIGELI